MHYFDNAATTYPKPNEVYEYMDSFYREYDSPDGMMARIPQKW